MAGKNKKPLHKVIIGESVFWLHTFILILITVTPLFMSWEWVIIILLAVRAQQIIFHGCILTILQAKEGSTRRGMAYYQLAAKRFFGVWLDHTSVRVVSISHNVLTLSVLLYANIEHVRLYL